MVTLEFYLIPKEGDEVNGYYAKYIFGPLNPTGLQGSWNFLDFGKEPIMLVGFEAEEAVHAQLQANNDVVLIPPLDSAVGGNPTLNRIKNTLSGMNIPMNYIVSTTLYREILRRTIKCFKIFQRMNGQGKNRFFTGRNLNTALDQTARDDLFQAGESYGLDTSRILVGESAQVALLDLADQLPSSTIRGEVF